MSRKIRYGMVGGGRGAFIGAVHRIAANMDGQIELVCGAFSSSPSKSKASGKDFFLPATAHLGKVGDRLTIMTFAAVDNTEAADWKPNVIVLGENNGIITTR